MQGYTFGTLIAVFILIPSSWMMNISAAQAGYKSRKEMWQKAIIGWVLMFFGILFALITIAASSPAAITLIWMIAISAVVATGTTYLVVSKPHLIT